MAMTTRLVVSLLSVARFNISLETGLGDKLVRPKASQPNKAAKFGIFTILVT